MKKLKLFLVIFVAAFAANVAAAWVFMRIFPESRWSWDTVTTTAVATAIIFGWALRDKRNVTGVTAKANEARKHAVEAAHARVLALFDTMSAVTNDDVQRALGVSDATATNYLSELEAQGRIRQVGEAGRPVRYVKNG